MNSIKTYVEGKTMKVYFIVSYNKKRFQIFTGLDTTVKFEGLVFPSSVINHRARTFKLTKLYSALEEYMITHSNESIQHMKKHLKAIANGTVTEVEDNILFYIDEYIKTKSKESTKQVFLMTRQRIERFDDKASFDTIDRNWLERFQAHELSKGRMINGIGIDLRNIRTIFNWAIDNEITTKYPFRKFQIKSEHQQYLYLNAKKMREFRDIPVEPFMEKYRDMFMLGFYLIGINLTDLLNLPVNCIKRGRIQYRRSKTSRLYDIKVEPEAMTIIEKYKGTKHLLSILDEGVKERSFSSRLNDYIKRIGPVKMKKNKRGALIKKVITPLHPDIIWYTARRSWATIAAELDIPKETIGRALGHSEWEKTTTDLYISFDRRKIDKANRKVIDYLNGDVK